MFDELNLYKKWNHFFVMPNSNLVDVCNAPQNASGVYLIYKLSQGNVELVYIDSAGKMNTNGKLQISKSNEYGLYEQIVNGHQFGDKRKSSWIDKMKQENIDGLDVYWYETFNANIKHIPGYVEGMLLQKHFEIYGRLPKWNVLY